MFLCSCISFTNFLSLLQNSSKLPREEVLYAIVVRKSDFIQSIFFKYTRKAARIFIFFQIELKKRLAAAQAAVEDEQ